MAVANALQRGTLGFEELSPYGKGDGRSLLAQLDAERDRAQRVVERVRRGDGPELPRPLERRLESSRQLGGLDACPAIDRRPRRRALARNGRVFAAMRESIGRAEGREGLVGLLGDRGGGRPPRPALGLVNAEEGGLERPAPID